MTRLQIISLLCSSNVLMKCVCMERSSPSPVRLLSHINV